MEQNPSWYSTNHSADQDISQPFMKFQDSLSSEATGPCREPDESNPYPYIIFMSFILVIESFPIYI
jgi:hypothetical protein